MNGHDRRVSAGDVIEIGEIVESTMETVASGLKLIALSKGETKEHVVLVDHFEDGGDVDVPQASKVLTVELGTGMENPKVWYAIPLSAYRGGDE